MLNLFIGIVRFYNNRSRNIIRLEEKKVKYNSVNITMDKNETNDEANLNKKNTQAKSWKYYLAFVIAFSHLLDSFLSLA
jgi:hypothetical protein